MEALGHKAGREAAAGAVFALVGGLGAGKTHWTKGFVTGTGCKAPVTSPTFGLVHQYDSATLVIYHFDFYRLQAPGEVLALGWDEYLEQGGVVIVEWADRFPEILPQGSRWLRFSVEADGVRRVHELAGPCGRTSSARDALGSSDESGGKSAGAEGQAGNDEGG